MRKRSMADLIGKELEALESKQSAWKQFHHIRARRKKVKLNIAIPARSYLRVVTLMEHIPSQYELEIEDIFEMLSDNATAQYGKEVNARNLYATFKAKQGRIRVVQNGETSIVSSEDINTTIVTVSLDYKFVLRLEWMCDDMANAIEGCNVMVEEYMSVLFTEFVQRLRVGEVPDLARQIGKHIEGGESA